MRFAVLVLAIVLSSQAWSGEPTRSDLEILRERATAYWAAKAKGSPVAEFYENGEVREGLGVRIESATVGRIEVLDAIGTVDVQVRVAQFTFATSPQMAHLLSSDEVRSRQIRDAWARIDGTWYRRPPARQGDQSSTHAASATKQSSGGEVASDHPTVSK